MERGLVFRWSSALPNFGVPLYFCILPSTQNYRISRGEMGIWGGDCCQVVSHAPTPWGRGPSATQFGGFISVYAYTLWRRATTFDVVTHVGRGVCLESAASPVPWERSSALFNNVEVLLCLCLHRLTQNDQIWHGNTWGGRVCFRGSATQVLFSQMRRAVCQRLRSFLFCWQSLKIIILSLFCHL